MSESMARVDDGESPDLGARNSALGLGVAAAIVAFATYFIASGRAYDYDGSVTVGAFVRSGGLFDVFRKTVVFNNQPYFSFIEHIVWDLGGRSEAWMRVAPVAAGAAAVGVFVAWSVRRWGVVAGVSAGLVFAANPLFADLSRSVRGYSLLVLGCTASTVILVDALGGAAPMTRARGVWYTVAIGIAIGTQFYAALVLAAHVATLIARRALDRDWRLRLVAAVIIGLLPYVQMINALADTAQSRRGTFDARFPLTAGRAILGQQYVAVVIIGVIVLVVLGFAARQRALLPAIIVIAVALFVVWVVLHPFDLYPRFLVWLVPAAAVAVAVAVNRRAYVALIVLVAVIAMISSEARTWNADPVPSRAVAQRIVADRAAGRVPCAVGTSYEIVEGYTTRTRSVNNDAQLAGCDSLFGLVHVATDDPMSFGCHFAHKEALKGVMSAEYYTDPIVSGLSTACT
jgi:hypothetical protein